MNECYDLGFLRDRIEEMVEKTRQTGNERVLAKCNGIEEKEGTPESVQVPCPDPEILIHTHTKPNGLSNVDKITSHFLDTPVCLVNGGVECYPEDFEICPVLESSARPIRGSGHINRVRKKILSMIPPHKKWIQPFFGTGSVFWEKEKAEIETINDKNERITAFLEQLRYADLERLEGCDMSPSKEKFYSIVESYDKELTVPMSFCEFLYTNKHQYFNDPLSYGDPVPSGKCKPDEEQCQIKTWDKKLPEWRERLEGVEVRNEDFREIMDEFKNDDEAFFFIDPPYATKSCKFEIGCDLEFEDVLNEAKKIKGPFLLIYEDREEPRKLAEREGFNVTDISHRTSRAGAEKEIKHLIVTNYDPSNLSQPHLAQEMGTEELEKWNQEQILGHILAIEEHLLNLGEAESSFVWCIKKHGTLILKHHIPEIKVHTSSNEKAMEYEEWEIAFSECLEHPIVISEVRELRNQWREIMEDETRETGCEICDLDVSSLSQTDIEPPEKLFWMLGVGQVPQNCPTTIVREGEKHPLTYGRTTVFEDIPSVETEPADPGFEGTVLDKRSVRIEVMNPETPEEKQHKVTIGCPKGKWDEEKGRCTVGTEATLIQHPMKEFKNKYCKGEDVVEAE